MLCATYYNIHSLTVMESKLEKKKRIKEIIVANYKHKSSLFNLKGLYKVTTVYKCKKLENISLSSLITEFGTYFPAAKTAFKKKYFIPLRQLKLFIADILGKV